MKRILSTVGGVLAAAALVLAPVSIAHADDGGDSDDAIIDSLFEESATLPENGARQLTPEEIEALDNEIGDDDIIYAPLADCSSWKNAVAVTTQWFQNTDTNCGLIGTMAGSWTYQWERAWFASGSVCLEGKGYYWTGSYAQEYWNYGGCTTGSASVGVSWQNILANTSIRHFAASAPVWGVAFNWR